MKRLFIRGHGPLLRRWPVMFACLFPLFFCNAAMATDAHFTWSPNTETNLAGYKIHYGTASRQYPDQVDVGMGIMAAGRVLGSVTGLTAGQTYYFAATAYDTDGFSSPYSTEVVWTAVDRVYPAAPEIMLTILKRNLDGTVDLLDAAGNVVATGVIIKTSIPRP